MPRTPKPRSTSAAIVSSLAVSVPCTAADAAVLQRDAEHDRPDILALTCDCDDDYEFLDERLSDLANRLDAVETMRTSATKPLLDTKRTIDGWFAPAKEAIQECIAHVKRVMGAYLLAKQETAREASEIAAVAQAQGDAEMMTAAAEIVADASAAVEGRATQTYYWRVKRVVEDMVPDEYWVIDYARLGEIAKAAGSAEQPPVVPGVIFERCVRLGARK